MILYNIFSLGFIGIFCYFSESFFLKVFCTHSKIEEVEFFKIIDIENKTYLIKAKRQNFYKKYFLLKEDIYFEALKSNSINNKYKKKKDLNLENIKNCLENSIYVGEDFLNSNDESIILYFKNNKYVYSEEQNSFLPVQLNLKDFTNNEIHENFSGGINDLREYNYLLNKFEENIMKLKDISVLEIILKRLLKPFNFYQLFIILFWGFVDIYYFFIIVIFFHFSLIMITSIQRYNSYKKIFNENYLQEPYKILSVKNYLVLTNLINIFKDYLLK